MHSFILVFPYLQVVCVGSIAELKQLSGVDVKDLHRETYVHLLLPVNYGCDDLDLDQLQQITVVKQRRLVVT